MHNIYIYVDNPILIRINDSRSHHSQSIRQYFGNDLNFKIGNRNGSEIFNGINTLNLRNERNHITIHPRRNPILFKKLLNNFANICLNNLPTRMIENTTKTIRTRSIVTIKIKNNILDFQITRTFN